MNFPLIGKKVAGVIGVILLGAIGSGVWQYFGEPMSIAFFGSILDVMNAISSSYIDSIYMTAAKGFHEEASTTLYINVLTGIPLFMTGVYFRAINPIKRKSSTKEACEIKENNKVKWPLTSALIFFVVFSLALAAQQSYTNRIVTYVEITLDRLAPFEPTQEILLLRARFREVKNSSDYRKLYEAFEAKLAKHSLESTSVEPL